MALAYEEARDKRKAEAFEVASDAAEAVCQIEPSLANTQIVHSSRSAASPSFSPVAKNTNGPASDFSGPSKSPRRREAVAATR